MSLNDREIPGPDARHTVLGAPLVGPWHPPYRIAVFGMGCFWGAERIFWRLPGVHSTSVGYAGGRIENPTYQQVCTGATGHAEAVQVVYDPGVIDYEQLLKAFWENHDPTQGARQGNDVGTEYRSVLYTTSAEQLALAEQSRVAFQPVVSAVGYGPITTHIGPLPNFYLAEGFHQQYLDKNPYGYCNHGPNGLSCPIGVARG